MAKILFKDKIIQIPDEDINLLIEALNTYLLEKGLKIYDPVYDTRWEENEWGTFTTTSPNTVTTTTATWGNLDTPLTWSSGSSSTTGKMVHIEELRKAHKTS